MVWSPGARGAHFCDKVHFLHFWSSSLAGQPALHEAEALGPLPYPPAPCTPGGMGALPPAAWALCPTAALALCPTRQGDPSVKYAVERLLAHPPHSNYSRMKKAISFNNY